MKQPSIRLVRIVLPIAVFCWGAIASAKGNDAPEVRCGWFENSAPNEASLTDKDGEWIVAMQGEHEAEGDWPTFKKGEWINTGNGSYGYGCACIKVKTDTKSRRITEISEAKAKPLSACRRDKKLKVPNSVAQ